MTYLALDVGTKRIGVAVGNTEVRLATPLAVVRRGKLENDAEQIRKLGSEYGVTGIVVGLPRELDGSIGARARAVIDYSCELQPLLGLDIVYADERYSTAAALARRREMGVAEKQGRVSVDAAAATIILQDFFDR